MTEFYGISLDPPPPPLSPAQQELEERLVNRVHPDYRHLPWLERTKEVCRQWDRVRRARLGLLGTYFPVFQPRWQHPEWDHFNRARQEADALGARYDDWLAVQFDRLLGADHGLHSPSDLHGNVAVETYKARYLRPAPAPAPGPARPFQNPQDYDPGNPVHRRYTEALLGELLELGSYICQSREQTDELVTEAVCRAVVPLQALAYHNPDMKARVEKAILARPPEKAAPGDSGDAHNPGEPGRSPGGGAPPVII
ncbi:MAG: hypothetical protein V1797_11035 [Pseudomonadota bacterium]